MEGIAIIACGKQLCEPVNGEEFVLQGDDAPQPGNNRRVVRLIGGLNHVQVRGQVEALGDGGPLSWCLRSGLWEIKFPITA